VHYRNLRDFFWQKDPQNDDLVASDYGYQSTSETPCELASIKLAVNKRLQHLSRRRLEENNADLPSSYDIASITLTLLTECADFRLKVGDSLHSEFPSVGKIKGWANQFEPKPSTPEVDHSAQGMASTVSVAVATLQCYLPEDLSSLKHPTPERPPMFSALKPMIKKALKDLSPEERDKLIDDLLPQLFEGMPAADRLRLAAKVTGLAADGLSEADKAQLLRDLTTALE